MTRPSIIVQADRVLPRREVLLILSLIGLVWGIQLRYPPLSYPHIGQLLLGVLCLVAIMLPVRLLRSMYGAPAPRLHPAALPALFFVIWALIRWMIAGVPFSGASDIGTIMWCSCYGILGYTVTRSAASVNDDSPTISVPRVLLAGLAAIGLAVGLHAVWQYFVAYADAHQQLLAAIGNRSPDRTEMALLHHLKLRRVASIFGDPNTLATFSAISLAAALELMTRSGSGSQRSLRILGTACLPICLAAVLLSGSRGGVLDCLIVLIVFAGYHWNSTRFRTRRSTSAAVLFLVVGWGLMLHAPVSEAHAQQRTTSSIAPASSDANGWFSRSSTITERLHYLTVGSRMIKMAPVTGLGPGSVERYFGRLKPIEARETKYLHNWIVQIWAELGLIAIVLAGWFLASMAVVIVRTRLWRRPADRALLLIFALLLLDGLIQVTWNQRELMSTFGLISGILMARTVRIATSTQERMNKPARLAVCILFIVIFASVETRFLAAKAAKYRASDAMAEGNISLALQEWTSASQWTPSDSEPLAARASIATAAHQYSAARQLLDKALTLNPDSASLNAEAAKVAMQLQQKGDARKFLERALYLYPSHPEYNYLMAQFLMSEGDRLGALKYARNAVNYNYVDEDKTRFKALQDELESLTSP